MLQIAMKELKDDYSAEKKYLSDHVKEALKDDRKRKNVRALASTF